MELLLNLVWLLLTLGLLLLMVRDPSFRHDGRAKLALLVVVVLLFPVISVTDDLQQNSFVIETRSSAEASNLWLAAQAQAVAVTALEVFSLESQKQVITNAPLEVFSPVRISHTERVCVFRRPPPRSSVS